MKIKEKPEDFIVNEVNNLKMVVEGPYVYFLLKKTDLTTEEAVRVLAKKFGIKEKNIGVAGNKDKKAVTQQYISIKTNQKISKFKMQNLELTFLGFGKERICMGDL
ncbi:tRNA pseudouridine(13) synthase TruD [Candidatus Woesearchaeota archaeon]|nr:tRNA pseudouridine(13) synthase TruD [Candidatus Woesearchaeota archaeon]